MKRVNKIAAVVFIIGLLVASYLIGVSNGINVTVYKVVKIIPLFANVTVDYQTVHDALYRYHNNLGGGSQCISISPLKE